MTISPEESSRKQLIILCIFNIFVFVACGELTILYGSDMSKIIALMPDGRYCSTAIRDQCVGGWPRLIHTIKEHRKQSKAVIFADLGNFAVKSLSYLMYHTEAQEKCIKVAKPDVMTIAPRDFFMPMPNLTEYLKNVKTPCVVTNMNIDREHSLYNIVKRSHVITIDNHKFGILGFIDKASMYSDYDGIEMENVFEALDKECKILHEDSKVVIAIGAAHFTVLKEILKKVRCLDVVLTSDSYSFLYNGEPRFKKAVGRYPLLIARNKKGTAGLLGGVCGDSRYLCRLVVEYSPGGELVAWTGQPLEMSEDVPSDPTVFKLMERYREGLDALFHQNFTLGTTRSYLQGTTCLKKECSLGNLFCDMVVTYGLVHGITRSRLAVLTGDVAYNSIDGTKLEYGRITKGDLYRILPEEFSILSVSMTGLSLVAMFETAVRKLHDNMTLSISFLQVSGMRVYYNLEKPPGQRIIQLKLSCDTCPVPCYTLVEPTKIYSVAMSKHLAEGSNQHHGVPSTIVSMSQWNASSVVIINWYLKKFSPVYSVVDGRLIEANLTSTAYTYTTFSFSRLFVDLVIIFVIHLFTTFQ